MKVFREYALASHRELSAELNRRMFYIGVRAFVLMVPKHVQAAKARAKAYIEEFRGQAAAKVSAAVRGLDPADEKGRRRIKRIQKKALRLVHLIAQSRRMKRGESALSPWQIKKQAATGKSEFRKGVGSVRSGAAAQGRIKASIAIMLHMLSKANLGRSFSQYGRAAKTNRAGVIVRPEQPPNAALAKMAGEYGVAIDTRNNVGIMQDLWAGVSPARPGANPSVSILIEGKIRSSQIMKVEQKLSAAFQQAITDEAAQLAAKMAEKAQAIVDRHSTA